VKYLTDDRYDFFIKSDCIARVTANVKNVSYCANGKLVYDNNCVKDYAMFTDDFSTCELIENKRNEYHCYLLLARTKKKKMRIFTRKRIFGFKRNNA